MIARSSTARNTLVMALAGTAMCASACAWPGSVAYTTRIGPPTADPADPPVGLPGAVHAPLVTVDARALQPGMVHRPGAAAIAPTPTAQPVKPTPVRRQAAPTTVLQARAVPGAPRSATVAQTANAETPPLNISQITFATEGADFDPCVTPDGTRIVYASTQHRNTADVYIKPVDGRVVTQLTNDPSDDLMPTVSPDGTRVAFCSNRSGNWDVYIMPITGGRAVQATSDPSDEIHPSWSPDGKDLVYSRMGETSGRWEMWVTDAVNQATSSFIGFGMFPQWCPTAGTGAAGTDRILYQATRERGQRAFGVWTIDYKDGSTTNMTEIASSNRAAFINPTWSPDGLRIVYASVPNPSEWQETDARPPSAELWMMNVDGTGRVNLTSGSTVALMPSWGLRNKLYFVAARGGTDNIWAIDLGTAILAASGGAPSGTATAKAHGDAAPTDGEPSGHEASAEPAKPDREQH